MKNSNEPKSWQTLLILREKALIPTTYDTETGVLLSDEPFWEFEYTDRQALLQALSEVISKGNPMMETPDPREFRKRKATEKRAKASSWADLERKSICFSITCWPNEYSIQAWGRAPSGEWGSEKEPALDIRIPADTEKLVDTILEHLKTRTDLPGLSFGQSQQRTARGA